MQLRRFRSGDEEALFEVYSSSIHKIAIRDYTVEQLNAWASASLDPEIWAGRMRGINPFVAVRDRTIVGYADVQPSGYIDHFFVSGNYPRRGIGTALMQRIHQEATAERIAILSSDVSRTAEGFFVRFGFEVVERMCPIVRGVAVPNALMRKRLQIAVQ